MLIMIELGYFGFVWKWLIIKLWYSELKRKMFIKNEIRKLFMIYYIRCYFCNVLKENKFKESLNV